MSCSPSFLGVLSLLNLGGAKMSERLLFLLMEVLADLKVRLSASSSRVYSEERCELFLGVCSISLGFWA